ncbi:putative conserved plasma membrane protein [Operophtera brumata]|uniref:Putative conserved plasma membrane protein n=1 Tax=Operophtera brumata TaxID=104452 RepID=A0A0L7LTC5_OPEBR|nr:putative conserved plasma membrane protein [Operophtera brumata]
MNFNDGTCCASPEPATPLTAITFALILVCMNFNDGTCCASPDPATPLTTITFALFLVCAVLCVVRSTWRWSQSLQQRLGGYTLVSAPPADSRPSLLAALAKLGMIMAYFYLCDRTNFFMKENKYYSEWSFWLPVGYVLAILHREQTQEWKGWMQLVVLVYQVTGASKVTPIYMLVRAIVSAYLFLTGQILLREQTREWKGWMQLVLLVYQVTGASKVTPIYMLVRAIVTAYLFLTG